MSTQSAAWSAAAVSGTERSVTPSSSRAGTCGSWYSTVPPRCRSSRMTSSARLSRTSSTSFLRSEEHTSELQSRCNLVCRLLLEKKKKKDEKERRLELKKYEIQSLNNNVSHTMNDKKI